MRVCSYFLFIFRLGVLEGLDTEKSTLTIRDAKKFVLGGVPVNCGKQVFHGEDVVNINIIEQTTAPPPALIQAAAPYQAPSAPTTSGFVDPAILRVGPAAPPQGVYYGQPPLHNNPHSNRNFNKNNERRDGNNNRNQNNQNNRNQSNQANYNNRNNQNNNRNQNNRQNQNQNQDQNQTNRRAHNTQHQNRPHSHQHHTSNVPIGVLPANENAPLKKEFVQDFEFSNNLEQEHEQFRKNDEVCGYNASSSFFDNISCEKSAKENRQIGAQSNQNENDKRRQVNIETFGAAQVPRGPGFFRSRRKRYYNNNNTTNANVQN